MDAPQLFSASIWLVMIVLAGFVLHRLKARRGHVGSAASGTVYDWLNDEKRNAVEVIVEDKAAERDEEHADDTVS